MPLDNWIIYITTVFILMSTPGPSHLLMLSSSAQNGFKFSIATALGDLSANLLQMCAAGLGIGTLVVSSTKALNTVKWVGVFYLIGYALYLLKSAHSRNLSKGQSVIRKSNRNLFFQGFITAASNPKAILFFAAFFPQFISFEGNFWIQFIVLSLTYLILDSVFLLGYGLIADRLVSLVNSHSHTWIHSASGVLLLIAALFLGLKQI